MKNLLYLLFFFSLSATAQTGKPTLMRLEEKSGFRDLKFGADTSELKGRVFVASSNYIRYYTRPTDNPKVGNSRVVISYGFYKGKLAAVSLKAMNQEYGAALLMALIGTYGKPPVRVPYFDKYIWDGATVELTYETSFDREAQAFISSRPIMFQIQAEQALKAVSAASDL